VCGLKKPTPVIQKVLFEQKQAMHASNFEIYTFLVLISLSIVYWFVFYVSCMCSAVVCCAVIISMTSVLVKARGQKIFMKGCIAGGVPLGGSGPT